MWFYFILFYYVRVKIPKTKITARNRIDSSYEKSIEAARHFYLVSNRINLMLQNRNKKVIFICDQTKKIPLINCDYAYGWLYI